MKKLKLSRIHMIIVGLLVAVAVVWWYTNRMSGETISNLTDKWIKAVTVNKDPTEIYDLFCSDGNLVGTVSQKKRIGEDIKKYFNYFATRNIHSYYWSFWKW